jgi:phage protein D
VSKVQSCYWNVYVNGSQLSLSKKNCIESIDIEELCDGSDTVTIKINDPKFDFIEDNIFIEDAFISVVLGWHGATYRVLFDGFISAIDIDFPESGCPTLSVFCLDNTHIMNRKKKSRSWDKVTRPEVVQKIAKEYGYKFVTEEPYIFDIQENIAQSEMTDIEFCESLAKEEREPFMCKLMGDTIYYVKKGVLKSLKAKLKYRTAPYDVISFTPQINKETKKEEVTCSDINTDDKTVDSSTSNNDTTSRDTQGDPVNPAPTGGRIYNAQTGTWIKVQYTE